MKCIDCRNSKFEKDESGIVDLICYKFKKSVLATTVCLDSKRSAQEERAKRIYLDNYQRYPLREVAKMIGWSVNKLNWFVISNFLPHGNIRKRKELLKNEKALLKK